MLASNILGKSAIIKEIYLWIFHTSMKKLGNIKEYQLNSKVNNLECYSLLKSAG